VVFSLKQFSKTWSMKSLSLAFNSRSWRALMWLVEVLLYRNFESLDNFYCESARVDPAHDVLNNQLFTRRNED
jgi:hypothetical protein